ncbi:MAG: hypothetical protein ACPG5B_13940 [Chitinophagales bacterium]
MRKTFFFLTFSVFITIFSCFPTNNLFAQKKYLDKVFKTILKATPKAEAGYESKRAEPLIEAVEILLKNKKIGKVSYKTISDEKRAYNNLLDITELLDSAYAFRGSDDEKLKKRIEQLKSKYSNISYTAANNGSGNIDIKRHEIASGKTKQHPIDCKNKTTIAMHSPANSLYLYVDNDDLGERKRWSDDNIPIGTCTIKLVNNKDKTVNYVIMIQTH